MHGSLLAGDKREITISHVEREARDNLLVKINVTKIFYLDSFCITFVGETCTLIYIHVYVVNMICGGHSHEGAASFQEGVEAVNAPPP